MELLALTQDGAFNPARIATALRTTSIDVAEAAGLGRDAIQRHSRLHSARTQRRLREMVEVLNRLDERFESAIVAYAWYRSVPLPGWGSRTAMDLVRDGRSAQVLETLNAIDAGVFA